MFFKLRIPILFVLGAFSILSAAHDGPVNMCNMKINSATIQEARSSSIGWTTIDGRDYVIKRLTLTNIPAAKAMFSSEIRMMKSIPKHDNLIQLIGYCDRFPNMFIVMEYAANKDLLKWRQAHYPNSKVPASEQLRILTAVANGMKELQQDRIVHTDLSARNVFMDAQTGNPKIGDFESAVKIPWFSAWIPYNKNWPAKRIDHWLAPETVGTPNRMHINSDVWSFGIVAFQLSTGRLSPFDNVDTEKLPALLTKGSLSPWTVLKSEILTQPNHGVPDFVQEIIQKCSEHQPDKRPSFADLKEMLEKIKL